MQKAERRSHSHRSIGNCASKNELKIGCALIICELDISNSYLLVGCGTLFGCKGSLSVVQGKNCFVVLHHSRVSDVFTNFLV